MDAVQDEVRRLREAVRDDKIAAASHRKKARQNARRLGQLEELCRKHGIDLTVIPSTQHEAPKGEHGGHRNDAPS